MKIEHLNQLVLNNQGLLKIAEVIILGFTLLFAIIIGIRQNNINQNLLDLNYIPSVEIVYVDNQIRIFNHGDKNIFVGTMVFYDKFSKGKKFKPGEEDIRLITPGGFYYFPVTSLNVTIDKYKQEYAGKNEEISIPFDTFLKSMTDKKYVAKNFLYLSFKNETTDIRTQTFSINASDW